MYKDQVGSMLYQHVFPVFSSPHGHLRARVCIRVFLKNDYVRVLSNFLDFYFTGLLVYSACM